MRIVKCIPAVIVTAVACFGQCNQYPLRPSLLPPCPTLADQLGKAIDASRDFQRASAQLTSQVEGARQAYWKVFPDGAGVKQAEFAFLKALQEKDFSYLIFALPLGMTDRTVQAANLMSLDFANLKNFPRNVDGGIRPYAFPLFGEWVNALRRSQGRVIDGTFTNPVIFATAYNDQSNWRKAYEDARNWAEFLASGLDIRKYLTPQVYIVNQMEADVAATLARSKPKDLPDPRAASMDLYNFFVKNFGEKEVLAAAAKTLAAPKNSVGGLAQRADVLIGTYQSQPSPNPYLLFLTQLTNATPHNYAMSLCLDQYGLMGKDAIYTFNSKEEWDKAAATYGQLKAKFGEPAIVAAAARIKDLPKDGQGGISGDNMSKGAIYWFTTLLKDPKAPLPESGQFLASSYDPRWIGKTVAVRGTVSRVDIDKGKFPPYATIHFKESSNDRITAYTPNSEILTEILPRGQTTLVGSVIEVYGDVGDWKDGAGVRFLIRNNLKILDAGALANFKESTPEWMKLPPAPPPSNLVDSPKYLAWKKFPVGSKATYYLSMLQEYKPGTNQYTKSKIAINTFKLASVDDTRVVINEDSTTYRMNGSPLHSTSELRYKAREPKAAEDPDSITTGGEETLSISGKKIATKWVMVAKKDDPQTFTKTWTSEEVPGGLVWIQSQSHSRGAARTISNNLYAPVEGVEPVLDNASSPDAAPPTAASPAPTGRPMNLPSSRGGPLNNPPPPAPEATPQRPVPANPVITPQRVPPASRPAAAPPAAGSERTDFLEHYRTVMQHYAQDRTLIAQAQRARMTKAPNAAEIEAALENLRKQQQASALALGRGDYAAGNQALQGMEDALTAIEKLTAK
jgi:hypothetical protein